MGSPYAKRRERSRRAGDSRLGRVTTRPANPSTVNAKMSIPTSRNFAGCYMELCKQQRVRPLPVICLTLPHSLDFTTDRVKMDDWGPILNSLSLDRSLKSVSVRSKYQCRKPLEEINSEDKARSMGKAPVVLTRYLLEWLSHSVAQCVRNSPALTSLELEGIPLPADCLTALCVGLAGTETLQHLSLQRCYIGDKSCELVCRTVADVRTIRSLNLSQCDLSRNSGPALAAALSRQKLSLYHDTWKQSLRYREPNLEAMPGLRRLTLNDNPHLGDEGVSDVIEAIRDSLWLKALDIRHCGLTDYIGTNIVELLDHNKTLVIIDVRLNTNLREEIVQDIFRKLEINNTTVGNGKSEYQWLSLPQKGQRNVVSAGARRKNRYEDINDKATSMRPKSAYVGKAKKPFVSGCVRRTPPANSQVVRRSDKITESRTIALPVTKTRLAQVKTNLDEAVREEEPAKTQVRPSLHVDLQSQIHDIVSDLADPQDLESKMTSNQETERRSFLTREAHSIEQLNTVLQQLSQARMEQDRLIEETKRTDSLLAEEKVRRESAESKLRNMKQNLSDLEAALKEKERETRGFLLVSQRSLHDIATSFDRLLGMLDAVTRNNTVKQHEGTDKEYSIARAEIRRRVANLIRKTKSESHGRRFRVEVEESSIIEASTGNSAVRKFAKSEGNMRSTLPPIVQPIRLERNFGDSPDVVSSRTLTNRTRIAFESYRECNEDYKRVSSPCERARAIFAEIVNGDAILHLGAHGS